MGAVVYIQYLVKMSNSKTEMWSVQVKSMVVFSAVDSSPEPIGWTSASAARKSFHCTTVLKQTKHESRYHQWFTTSPAMMTLIAQMADRHLHVVTESTFSLATLQNFFYPNVMPQQHDNELTFLNNSANSNSIISESMLYTDIHSGTAGPKLVRSK